MKMFAAVTIGIAATILFADGSAIAAEKKLAGDAIKTAFAGATISGRTNKGAPFQVEYGAAGEIVGFSAGHSDTGKWWVNGDTVCRKWKNWDQGRERCSTIKMDGDKISYERTDGSGSGNGTLEK